MKRLLFVFIFGAVMFLLVAPGYAALTIDKPDRSGGSTIKTFS